jgi:hypothetical protein
MAIASRRALKGAVCAALVLLAACAREGRDQMSWARAALERNGQIEIVASDPQSRTFTVRVKESGELRMVRADQVVAEPALGAESSTPAVAAAASAASAAPPASPQALTASSAADGASASAAETAAPAEAPAEESAAVRPAARTAGGPLLESGPGYSIEAASGAAAAAVTQSGPGYSIKAASPAAAPPRARLRDAGVTSAAVERRREPIICQGARLLHIDNRNLEFDGDAVSAEDGCEIHITNSHISATGVGVLARGANVHIDNSLIEGDAGSIDASDGAQVYAAFSHFRGLSRRLDTAVFHDLGGNIWN